MIAYYVWTDLQIFNSVNLQLNQNAKEDADLFVLMLSRVSEDFLAVVERSGAFKNVFRIKLSHALFTRKDRFSAFLSRAFLCVFRAPYFSKIFRRLTEGKKYSKLITAGFWAKTIYLVKLLVANNPDLKIDFIEEGTRNGDCFFASTLSMNHVIRVIYAKDDRITYQMRRHYEYAWVYVPERYLSETSDYFVYNALSPIDAGNPKMNNLCREYGGTIDISEYTKRRFVFFYDQEFSSEEGEITFIFDDLIQQTAKKFGADQIIVKFHPEKAYFDIKKIKKIPEVFYDNRKFCFDAILKLLPLEEKVFIVNRSSIMASVFLVVKKKVKTVFIYTMTKQGKSPHYYMNEMTKAYSDYADCQTEMYFPSNFTEYKKTLGLL